MLSRGNYTDMYINQVEFEFIVLFYNLPVLFYSAHLFFVINALRRDHSEGLRAQVLISFNAINQF